VSLVERDEVLASLRKSLDSAGERSGSVVLIRGEAGIGKTAVTRAFVDSIEDEAHVLWGGCDDLLTARPLGPLWDMSFDEPELADSLRDDDRQRTFGVLLELLTRALRPTVVVIEDVHWADEATLDMIKFAGRRIGKTHGLMILTFRDGEAAGDHPLRLALGDLPHDSVLRIALTPLTPSAVSSLAEERGDADQIWEITGGNPFFVTELLSSGEDVPLSIRDAVRSRVLRLSAESRDLVELASVAPRQLEIRLAREILGEIEPTLAEAENSGLLTVSGDAMSFRHELARRAVEGELSEIRRRRLNLAVMTACEALGEDLARCAHHARAAGEPEAMLRLLPDAAQRAASVESHHEAVSHLRALEPLLDRMTEPELADHYDLWAYEEYLASNAGGEDLIERAIELRRKLGDPAALGASLLAASRIAWVNLKRDSAVEYAGEAASVLEPVGGESLAMAYATVSQLAMLANEEERAIRFGEMALEHAGAGPSQPRAHALNNIGAVVMNNHYPEGADLLEESYEMSEELGLVHDQTRAAVNLTWGHLFAREVEKAEVWLERGRAVVERGEMPAFESYIVAIDAIHKEMTGEWSAAESLAQSVLERQAVLETSKTAATITLARLAVRRGQSDAKHLAMDAWERGIRAGEIQRLGPAAAVLAEFAWLGGEVDEATIEAVVRAFQQCLDLGAGWLAGDIGIWLVLGGIIETVPEDCPEPYVQLGGQEWAESARFWEARGIPYELGVALSRGDESARLRALEILEGLGAAPLASRVRAELQSEGVRGIPRGPSRATRENPLGLTPRQTEVLSLLAQGLTNAEIADRLFLSTRTVDHHVSAILTRSGAEDRSEAVEIARATGVVA
jgi:predicted ATPase/DNA-binding CsgD family transcriptional regulator